MLFAIKYTLMSIVINVLLGYIFSIINKNISFKLERIKQDETRKKK